ncbi:hypothetical protein [Leptothoe sp. PORK10 BA2]|uniref:hypothetical protein n=1 Tax=Leptothoe sp. PORK10 BA2 TaxID=3110254 RepID=UPI002B201339|nr:hypothetical protein [Leptothoe sp. PORK10 BA2]MEA5462995.1 hypothetical protein [Leptothoe sp. PORK10 BA2]
MSNNFPIVLLIALGLGCLGCPPTLAQSPTPADLTTPGWGSWRPQSEQATANIDAGFSNQELGGFMEMEFACQQSTGLDNNAVDYWFRPSRLVALIGTGEVEYGCWHNGRFLHTFRSTATRSDISGVDCLRVNSEVGNGLIIRKDSTITSQRLGVVANGGTVTPNSYPAIVHNQEERDWLAIEQPMEGWISIGQSPSGFINLSLCSAS